MQDSEVLIPIQVPFRLGAVINHSGPFGRGHYWTNVWYHNIRILCNDQAVIRDGSILHSNLHKSLTKIPSSAGGEATSKSPRA